MKHKIIFVELYLLKAEVRPIWVVQAESITLILAAGILNVE